MVLIGFAADTHAYKSVPKQKLMLSVNSTFHGTIINSGPETILSGDRVAFEFPYFDKFGLPPVNPDMIGVTSTKPRIPNKMWGIRNSGNGKTARLIMHVRRVTPAFIANLMIPIFYKLIGKTPLITKASRYPVEGGRIENDFYPTARFIGNTMGSMALRTAAYSSSEVAAISQWNIWGITGLHLLRECLTMGLVKPADDILGYNNIKKNTNVLLKVARLIGFHEKPNQNEETKSEGMIQRLLYSYFYDLVHPSIKRQLDIKYDKEIDQLGVVLMKKMMQGTYVSQERMNHMYMHQTNTTQHGTTGFPLGYLLQPY